MNTFKYIIPGNPISWVRSSPNKSQRSPEAILGLRSIVIDHLKEQHGDKPLFNNPMQLEINYFFEIPDHIARNNIKHWVDKPVTSLPTILSCNKFIYEVCQDILFNNERLIWRISEHKVYSSNPRTELIITLEVENENQ